MTLAQATGDRVPRRERDQKDAHEVDVDAWKQHLEYQLAGVEGL